MTAAVFMAFLAYTTLTAFTPGPNNILALNAGSRHGLRGSLTLVAGMSLGFLCVMLLCGMLSLSMAGISERFLSVMRYVGVAYMFWLSWKIATAASQQRHEDNPESGFLSGWFRNGFLLQFANVKIIIYGLSAMSVFILPYYRALPFLAGFVLLLTAIGTAGMLAWALAGAAMQRFLQRHALAANRIMGFMLAGCAVHMIWQAYDCL